MKVSVLKTEMDGRFAAVDERFVAVDEQFDALRQLIATESEATRRHFDVVAEKIVDERNLALDRSMATAQQLVALAASNAADHVRLERRLDEHDRRLETLEQSRNTRPENR